MYFCIVGVCQGRKIERGCPNSCHSWGREELMRCHSRPCCQNNLRAFSGAVAVTILLGNQLAHLRLTFTSVLYSEVDVAQENGGANFQGHRVGQKDIVRQG